MPTLSVRWNRARRRALFVVAQRLALWLGLERTRRLGEAAGTLQRRLDPRTFRRIRDELSALLGRPRDDPRSDADLRRAYRLNNGAVFEILALLVERRPAEQLAGRVEIEGLENLRAALAGGRGAILLGTHAGNAALALLALAEAGLAVSVVYRQARMNDDGFFERGFERYGVQAIRANDGLRAYAHMLSALRQGRVVYMTVDQGTKEKGGLVRRFLGKDMPMPGGPAQLAKASRAPVLPLATLGAEPRWRFAIEPKLALGLDSVEDDLGRLCETAERQVRAHPELWTWHHRRWRRFPLAGADGR